MALVGGETHYQRHKDEYLARNREKKTSLKRFLNAVKSYPCLDCGKSYPAYVMQFDHLPGLTKKHEPARLVNTGSWTAVIEEIMKCEEICANCHAERTHNRITVLC
jgi:hypothetical protein